MRVGLCVVSLCIMQYRALPSQMISADHQYRTNINTKQPSRLCALYMLAGVAHSPNLVPTYLYSYRVSDCTARDTHTHTHTHIQSETAC